MRRPALVTLDLDDTLIQTQQDYDRAREWFGDFVAQRYDVDASRAEAVQKERSRELLDEYQLSRHRFPQATREALQRVTDDPSETALRRVEAIGWSVYKDRDVYDERGFRNGGDDLVAAALQQASTVVLVTAGDPIVQERKIEALDLRARLDAIHVVGMGEKEAILRDYGEQERLLHIGNSTSSDVRAAAAANVDCLYVPDGEWRSDSPNGADEYDGDGTCISASSPAEAARHLRSL